MSKRLLLLPPFAFPLQKILLFFDNIKSDYDVFLSPLSDFKAEMSKAGLDDQVVYLDRGDAFEFQVRQPKTTT